MNGKMFARAGFSRSVARFLLLGVLLPNVAFLGHWGFTDDAESSHQHETGGEHELHCHSGPATCTGGVATVSAIKVGEDAGLIAPAGTVRPILDAPDMMAPEPPYARLLQPPQAV